jgi:hypothetical protein
MNTDFKKKIDSSEVSVTTSSGRQSQKIQNVACNKKKKSASKAQKTNGVELQCVLASAARDFQAYPHRPHTTQPA